MIISLGLLSDVVLERINSLEIVSLDQWFLTFTNMLNPYVVFQAFVEPLGRPLGCFPVGLVSRTCLAVEPLKTAPLNPRDSIKTR